MREAKLRGRFADAGRLLRIERTRQSGPDVAESTGARAGIAHDHERCVLFLPALPDVRTARLLADGDEVVLAHDRLGGEIAGGYRRLDTDPLGLLEHRGIRSMRLFRMARTRVIDEVEDDGHGLTYGCAELPASHQDGMAQNPLFTAEASTPP